MLQTVASKDCKARTIGRKSCLEKKKGGYPLNRRVWLSPDLQFIAVCDSKQDVRFCPSYREVPPNSNQGRPASITSHQAGQDGHYP